MKSEDLSLYDNGESNQDSSFQPKKIVRSLLQRWYWLLLFLLLGLGWGFYQAWRQVPIYRTQAVVLVRDYSVSALQTLDVTDFDVRSTAALETVRTGLMKYELCERVASDPRIRSLKSLVPPPPKKLFPDKNQDQVVDEPKVPPAPQLAMMIRSWLSVDLQKESRLMTVVIQHPDANVAATIANTIVDEYMEQRAEAKEADKLKRFELLSAQAERLKEDLSRSKVKLAIYETPNKAELALASAEQQLEELKLRYRDKHPDYIKAKRKVDQTATELREVLQRLVVNPTDMNYWEAFPSIVTQLQAGGKLDLIREKLIERRVQLETEIESQGKITESLLNQLETLGVNSEQNEAEVIPYESARPYRNLVTEAKSTMITKNGVFGLLAGIALSVLFQLLDNKFHTVDELETRSSLPVLAAIPQMSNKVLKRLKGGVLPERKQWAPTLIFGREDTQTTIAESFRILRAAVSLLGPSNERKVTLVTSALPSEGKTTVASNLACAMAEEGKKVALVDLDLRKPSLHKGFGMAKNEKGGIVDILSANADPQDCVITETGLPKLYLFLSGNKAPNPGELLNSDQVTKFIAFLRKNFDHVIIDSAPILAVADSRLISPMVDNFLFVVRAESTPKGAVDSALEILEGDGKRPSGLILNDFLDRRLNSGKKYRYGYYRSDKYTYGSYGSDEN